jgi:phosphatidylglycerol:prolipoprotein diacylglycerol transferase
MFPIFLNIPLPAFLVALLHTLGIDAGESFAIHTYGVMAAVGFFIAISLANKEAVRRGMDADQVTNLLFGTILWGVIGSRLLFVALEWQNYVGRPAAILNIREGGLVWQGGLIGAVIYSIIYMQRHGMPFWKTADTIILGIPLGHTFGRLGCLAAGCCYGRQTDLPWAIVFSNPESAGAPLGVPLHPVQIYESLGNFAVFAVLAYVLHKRLRFDGQVFLGYFISYPILRIFTELFRGDIVRGFFLQDQLGQVISTSQAISLVELAVAIAIYRWRRSHGSIETPPSTPTALPTPG